MSTAHGIETEIKIRIPDPAAAQRRLTDNGFSISVPRRFESNTLYDTPDASLKRSQTLLRLRQVGGDFILTWKGPGVPGPHKARPEVETSVGSAEAMEKILRALGYEPVFRYDKFRTEYTQANAQTGVVTLDETPIGHFFELEGPADWIDYTAAQLGFDRSTYVLASYCRLYLDYCAAQGIEPSNMTFPPAS